MLRVYGQQASSVFLVQVSFWFWVETKAMSKSFFFLKRSFCSSWKVIKHYNNKFVNICTVLESSSA